MRRNRLRRDFAEALWAANTLTLLAAVGGELAATVDYDAWFTKPAVLAAHLRAVVGLPPAAEDEVAPSIAPLIEPRLRHHQGSHGDARPAFEALHAALVSQTPRTAPEGALAPAIEAARATFNSLSLGWKAVPGR
jgi:hypothetical protein